MGGTADQGALIFIQFRQTINPAIGNPVRRAGLLIALPLVLSSRESGSCALCFLSVQRKSMLLGQARRQIITQELL